MSVNLTAGAIEALFNECPVINPVLQVMYIREYPPGKQVHTRYRLNLSDGVRSLSCFLLASRLNHLKEAELLVPNCVCMLKKISPLPLFHKRLLVVVDMDVLQTAVDAGGKIGNPTQLIGQTTGQQEANPSTSSSDEIPGPSGYGTSGSCENSQMKSSPMMSSWKASPMKASGMMSSMKASGMMSSMKASGMPSSMKASGMPSSMKASGMPSSMKASGMPSPMKASGMPSPMKASGMPSPMKASPVKGSGMSCPMQASTSSSPSQRQTKLTPIYELHPYLSNWTVRARVTNKSDIRNWSNSRGEGKVFSFEVLDESGEIRITAFNSEVDKFFSLVEQNKVYLISKGSLKVANKQYTSLKNDYEITLGANSCIVPCEDSQGVPTVHCDFVPISQLEGKDLEAIIDVIGVCEEAEDVSLITTKAGKQLTKRALVLSDSSGKMVTLTLWGDQAQMFNASCHPVVAVKGARLSTFGGRSLAAFFSSTVMVNPDIPEAFELRAWYNQVGHGLCSQSLTESQFTSGEFRTNWKSLSDVKTEQLGHGEKADYFSCVATVVFARKENCLYRACPSESCNKKVQEQDDGRYHCDKCGKDYPDFKYRFMLSVNLADFGDNVWATCFQDTAETLLGLGADRLGRLKDTDEDAFNEVFQKVHFSKHIFRSRVKLETYNDECRVKVTVMEVLPVDHRQHSRRLLNSIRALACGN